ncbi:MAG TPA: sigma-54 dependent transcriptional regulator [Candidatus Paceibacterota bacterium]|nr:sigma-54-dependent Fis family transcriptional regulator [Verrucomicrobiota bacterium]HOX04189.1 sigma-54 dependent transcriptional regulator [Verrucomicrobiota bacterium]HRZ47085.1 sigma-54 dependent transcriptional regulator [Candidatus Paceibacterota bacterium]HRZ92672.1 sigma-54 dependent transcriptional regulator [Candidatus Paceibacterota bacterium]
MQPPSLTGLSVMVLEDDPLLRRQIAAALERLGADVTSAGELGAARRLARELDFDFALLDLNLPDGMGMDLLREKAFSKSVGIVIMTANSNVPSVVEAMKLGALDYLVKPFNPAELPLVLERARRARQSARREEHLREESGLAGFFFGDALAEVKTQLEKILAADQRVEGTPPPVLIQGETGTGKTTIARWIHQQGPRSAQPLVEVNCSALPETLAESELFGHERGAFTDAKTARMGLFEAAAGGTLFLDELPSLSLALQAKVLTALEDRKIRRVGGNAAIQVDVRLIAAASQSLTELVAARQFREDLYHRLDLFRVRLPPLRERGMDILRLAELLLEQISRRHRTPKRSISPMGAQRLLGHPWPGNVRELAHELERAVVFESGPDFDFRHLGGQNASQTALPLKSDDWFNDEFVIPASGFSVEEAVLRIIRHALRQSGGNLSAAARLLSVPRDYLRYRLEKKEIDRQ